MPPLTPLEDLYIRLAAVEIQYANAKDYATAIADSITAEDPGIPIMNGKGRSFENGDTELRIVLASPIGGGTLTICYWQVPGKSKLDLTKIYKDYTKPGSDYSGVKAPFSESGIEGDNEVTVRCILRSSNTDTNTQVGLLVNPPFPRGLRHRHLFVGKRNRFMPLALVVGLGLGIALPSLFKIFSNGRN